MYLVSDQQRPADANFGHCDGPLTIDPATGEDLSVDDGDAGLLILFPNGQDDVTEEYLAELRELAGEP